MRISENFLKNSSFSNGLDSWIIESGTATVSNGILRIEAPTTLAEMYQLNVLPNPSGTYTCTAMVRGKGVMWIQRGQPSEPPVQQRIPSETEWAKITYTLAEDGNRNWLIYLIAGADAWLEVDWIHVARGTQGANIWTPAHSELTPEQEAFLPPYGEYKEIKSF